MDPRLAPRGGVKIGASAPPPPSRRRQTGPSRADPPDRARAGQKEAADRTYPSLGQSNQPLCASASVSDSDSETVYRTGPTGPSVMIWNHDFL